MLYFDLNKFSYSPNLHCAVQCSKWHIHVHCTYTLVTYIRRCHLGECVFQSCLNFANLRCQVVECVNIWGPYYLFLPVGTTKFAKLVHMYYSRKGWGPVMSDWNNIWAYPNFEILHLKLNNWHHLTYILIFCSRGWQRWTCSDRCQG